MKNTTTMEYFELLELQEKLHGYENLDLRHLLVLQCEVEIRVKAAKLKMAEEYEKEVERRKQLEQKP